MTVDFSRYNGLHYQPYWRINTQDARLKSSAISLWSLIGAEGQEVCFVRWLIAFMDPTGAKCV